MLNFTMFVCGIAAAVLAVVLLTGASIVFWIPVVAVPTLLALTFAMGMSGDFGRDDPPDFEWRRW